MPADRTGGRAVMGPDWLAVAYREMRSGVTEIAGPKANPRIASYHAATTLHDTSDETAWCSAFVCWCLEEAGIESTRSAMARSWLGWGARVSTIHPPIGAVLVFSRGAYPQPGRDVLTAPGHVGLFVGHSDPGYVLVLGGNQSDTIKVTAYSVHALLGARWAHEEG